MEGSSSDKIANMSSIKYWEHATGMGRRCCAYSDCNEEATTGGHLWIKKHSGRKKGVWIAPICKKCNYCENLGRMRNAESDNPFVRKGTVLCRTKYTPDMENAEPRVATGRDYDSEDGFESDDYEEDDWDQRVCEVCHFDLPFGTPSHHTK